MELVHVVEAKDQLRRKARRTLLRDTRVALLALGVVISMLGFGGSAKAFMGTEDEQFQADINEAKARAHDFEKHLERSERLDREREEAASELAGQREREQKEIEETRRSFVLLRDKRANEEAIREELEREDNLKKEKEAQEMDQNRRDYVAKRDRVRKVIGRDAHIDESREYGL
jgi:hypothetical protein